MFFTVLAAPQVQLELLKQLLDLKRKGSLRLRCPVNVADE